MRPVTQEAIWQIIQNHELRLRAVESSLGPWMTADEPDPEPVADTEPPPDPVPEPPPEPELIPSTPAPIEPAPATPAPAPVEPPPTPERKVGVYTAALARLNEGQDAEVVKKPEPPTPPPTPVIVEAEPKVASIAPAEVRKHTPFLTDEEVVKPNHEVAWDQERQAEEPPATLEERIGTTWLLRIGGVLIMLGAAWGAIRFESNMSPLMRVIAGYMLAAGIGVAGAFVRFRNDNVGRAGLGIALALGYFVSFASHYIGRMNLGLGWPWFALGGMLIHAGVLVRLAERWRSEAVAGFGLCLALIPALMCAQTSNGFALLAIMGLGLASGVLLLRNGWMRLTSVAVALVYGAIGAVAFLETMGGGLLNTKSVLSYLAALAVQHAIFVGAFMRWSRPWLARERALDRMEEEAVPSGFVAGLLPWGRGFDVLNTLGLIASVLLLGWLERASGFGLLWLNMHVALGVIGGIELLRLATAAGRDEHLGVFHSVTGALLGVAAIAWGLDGASEALALSLVTVVLVVAARQAHSLRGLRFLAGVPALLALFGAMKSIATTTTPELGTILTPVLLLASTLPFDRWLGKSRAGESAALNTLGNIADHLRAAFATIVAMACIFRYGNSVTELVGLIVLAAGLMGGMALLRFNVWREGVLLATAAFIINAFMAPHVDALFHVLAAFGLGILAVLWASRLAVGEKVADIAISGFGALCTCGAFVAWHLIGLQRAGLPLFVEMAAPTLFLVLTHPMLLWSWLRRGRLGDIPALDTIVSTVLSGLVMIPLVADSHRVGSALPMLIGASTIAALALVRPQARHWRYGVLLALTASVALAAVSTIAAGVYTTLPLAGTALLVLALADLSSRRLTDGKADSLWPVMAVPATLVMMRVAFMNGGDWTSVALLGLGVLAYAAGRVIGVPAPPSIGRLGATIGTAICCFIAGAFVAVLHDAPVNLVPGLFISLFATAVWVRSSLRGTDPPVLTAGLQAAALSIAALTLLRHFGIVAQSALAIGMIGVGFHIASRMLGRNRELAIGSTALVLSLGGIALIQASNGTVVPSVVGVILAVAALALTRVRYFRTEEANNLMIATLMFGGTAVLLRSLSLGALLPGDLVTAAWGAVAAGLLVAGFIMRSALWRRTAIAIFGLALLRVIVIDLSGSSINARILACLVVGVLMVGSAYLYGILARTFLPREE
ncbi:hypothetical protein GC173_05650 [bacterium]|nr:hypothetical protein [bacterium]